MQLSCTITFRNDPAVSTIVFGFYSDITVNFPERRNNEYFVRTPMWTRDLPNSISASIPIRSPSAYEKFRAEQLNARQLERTTASAYEKFRSDLINANRFEQSIGSRGALVATPAASGDSDSSGDNLFPSSSLLLPNPRLLYPASLIRERAQFVRR